MYNQLPFNLGIFELADKPEMMFVQYMPIKMKRDSQVFFEKRLRCFGEIIQAAVSDYIRNFGIDDYIDSYLYLTAKYMWQDKNIQYNRGGWHCDGFMTDDINYIWSDADPTLFSAYPMELTQDDAISMKEMENLDNQSVYIRSYPDNSLLRLNQYCKHRVADCYKGHMRSFLKLSFSKDKYDLEGNAHNYLLNYKWDMRKRDIERNIPQLKEKES